MLTLGRREAETIQPVSIRIRQRTHRILNIVCAYFFK